MLSEIYRLSSFIILHIFQYKYDQQAKGAATVFYTTPTECLPRYDKISIFSVDKAVWYKNTIVNTKRGVGNGAIILTVIKETNPKIQDDSLIFIFDSN